MIQVGPIELFNSLRSEWNMLNDVRVRKFLFFVGMLLIAAVGLFLLSKVFLFLISLLGIAIGLLCVIGLALIITAGSIL